MEDTFLTKLHGSTIVDASLKGIKLSHLYDAFITKKKQDFEEKTLDEFVNTYLNGLMKDLKPDEDPKKYFYADYLKETSGDSFVGDGEVFIACERAIKFSDMMETLKDHFRTKPDIHVCIDAFTHGMPFENGTVDEELYENRIKEIGYLVIVMSPWDNIGFFQRTALLFELYAAIKHGCKVEVAMGTKEKKTLIDVVEKQGVQKIQQALELIDFEKSKSNLEELAVVIKRKVISGKSYDDANLLIINVVRDCLMAVISKSSELELLPYRYSIELLTFQAKMKIHESIKIPNVKKVLIDHKYCNAGNKEGIITAFYDEVTTMMFLPEKNIRKLQSLNNLDAIKKIKEAKMMTNLNIFRIYSDIIIGVLRKRDPMAIKFFDLYVYSLYLSEDEKLLSEAENKFHQLMMLWESDIDEIIPDVNSVNSVKITFKTALPLSYYRYMQKAKNGKSLLLCLKNTEYGGAWRITMVGISRKLVRCECSSGKSVVDTDVKGSKVTVKRQVDWEVEETFKPKLITETAVMGNFNGQDMWYPAIIREANDDGTFDIKYKDGRHEEKVGRDLLQVKFSENMDEKIVYLQKRKVPSKTLKGQKWNPKRAFFAPIPKFYCSCKDYTLLGVDLVKQTFQADVVFEFRLNEIGSDANSERYVEEYFSEYGLDLKNIINFRSDIVSNGSGGKESVEQMILYEPTRSKSFMYDYTIQCQKQSDYKADKLDMHNFPFDQQELALSVSLSSSKLQIELEIEIEIENQGEKKGEKVERKDQNKNQEQLVANKEYEILFHNTDLKKPWMKPNDTKSEMTYSIYVRRDYRFYIYSTIMPLVSA